MFLSLYTSLDHAFKKNKKISIIFIIILFFFTIFCLHKSHKHEHDTTPRVSVETLRVGEMPIYLQAIGTVKPLTSITLKTQINGQLLKIHFQEGQMVKTGDLLIEIDSRTYEAQLAQFEGQLLKDQALLENAKLDLARYNNLVKKDLITQQTVDTQLSLVHQYEGNIKSDQALIALAKLNIMYCRITAPIDGRIGFRLVDSGNFVQTQDTNGLAILNSVNPISVIFALPQDNLEAVTTQLQKGKLPVDVFDKELSHILATGTIDSIDNQINTNTGTIKLRALLNNDTNKLFPNQFVNVRILLETLKEQFLVLKSAVQQGTQGCFVYRLKKNHQIEIVPVDVKAENEEFMAISGHLSQNDSIVTTGLDQLREGITVKVIKSNNNLPSHKKKDEPV